MSETHGDSVVFTDEELQELREAGASAEFMAVVTTSPGVVGIDRNIVRETAKQGLRREHSSPDPNKRNHGSFYGHLWDGELGEAVIKADLDNLRILFHHFTPEYVIERLMAAGESDFDYVNRLITEKYEQVN